MNEKQRTDAIYKTIKQNDRITFNKLFDIVKEIGDGLSRTSLRSAINYLIEDDKIAEIRIPGKQLVMFTDKVKLVKEEKRKIRKFKKIIKENKKRLTDLDDILDFLHPSDAYFMFGRFVRLMWPLDLLFFETRQYYHTLEFKELFSEFDSIKKDFFILVNRAISEKKLTPKDFTETVFSYSDAFQHEFDLDMQDFQFERDH